MDLSRAIRLRVAPTPDRPRWRFPAIALPFLRPAYRADPDDPREDMEEDKRGIRSRQYRNYVFFKMLSNFLTSMFATSHTVIRALITEQRPGLRAPARRRLLRKIEQLPQPNKRPSSRLWTWPCKASSKSGVNSQALDYHAWFCILVHTGGTDALPCDD